MMPHAWKHLKSLAKRLLWWTRSEGRGTNYPLALVHRKPASKGRVLFSYLSVPVGWKADDRGFEGHTNKWESREIARIFFDLGYHVDAMEWADSDFLPFHQYDVLFDICLNLQRIAPMFQQDCVKILHNTGSYQYFQNHAEMKRAEEFTSKTKTKYTPRRLVAKPELVEKSLQLSDACSLLGSSFTLRTYPERFRSKISLCKATYSTLRRVKHRREFAVGEDFLWFGGSGLVLKGLDLILDIFLERPRLTLHVVGPFADEKEFGVAYGTRIDSSTNVFIHGVLNPASAEFENTTGRCGCFLAPSASEGMSTSVLTCMAVGLYPIVSRECGVELPDGCGLYIDRLEKQAIEVVMERYLSLSKSARTEQIACCQAKVLHENSRAAFRSGYRDFLVCAGL